MSLQTGKRTTLLSRGLAYIRVLILIIDIYCNFKNSVYDSYQETRLNETV